MRLHDYHRDGYPALLAFRDGEQVLNGYLDDYGTTFKERAAAWWPDQPVPTPLLPAGMKMADNWQLEAKERQIVWVVANDDSTGFAANSGRFADKRGMTVKYEGQLTQDDRVVNLYFDGTTSRFSFGLLAGTESPISFDTSTLHIGPYTFPRSTTALRAIAPNPFNRERYLTFNLTAERSGRLGWDGWADFALWQYDSTMKEPRLLMDGRFAKDDQNRWTFARDARFAELYPNRWTLADSLMTVYTNLRSFCTDGVCPVPGYPTRLPAHRLYSAGNYRWEEKRNARLATMGDDHCRFPSLALAPDGRGAVAWEENGDILLATIDQSAAISVMPVEDCVPDAYNPVVAWDGNSVLILYLSNADGFYHLYGRYLDGDRLSGEIRFTGPGSYDVITPAVAASNGKAAVAWSEWRANLRFPKYRLITNRTLGPVKDVVVVPDGAGMDYTNAWYLSLTMNPEGKPFGMWNQHYPSSICVCGGPLDGPASTPQKLTGNAETSETGEYPGTAIDSLGDQWAVWCTDARSTYNGTPQQVLVARFDSASGSWSTPYTASDTTTFLNQTPRLAIGPDGTLWVVYSGRPRDESKSWGVYLSSYRAAQWQRPALISTPGVCGREPDLAVDSQGKPWVTWHSGTGATMKIQVWTAE